METILVKFDELTALASECNNSGPSINCSNFQDSSEELNEIPSQQDLDNLFGPLNKEYYALSTSEVSNNSVVNTLDDEDTPSPSLLKTVMICKWTELVVESSKEDKAEVTEGSSKKDREELDQENAKKQKMDLEAVVAALSKLSFISSLTASSAILVVAPLV
nr:hypothetical protein [Tanacetum cinerariifolium]